jgi:hypothetical protein
MAGGTSIIGSAFLLEFLTFTCDIYSLILLDVIDNITDSVLQRLFWTKEVKTWGVVNFSHTLQESRAAPTGTLGVAPRGRYASAETTWLSAYRLPSA